MFFRNCKYDEVTHIDSTVHGVEPQNRLSQYFYQAIDCQALSVEIILLEIMFND